MSGFRRKIQRGGVLPPANVQTLPMDQAKRYAALGARFITQTDAGLIWNSAAAIGPQMAPQLTAAIAAGAVIHVLDEIVVRLCGSPPDPAAPFAALPEWAVEIFKRVGIIESPAPAEDPSAPAKPVESRQELVERATRAGIVLA